MTGEVVRPLSTHVGRLPTAGRLRAGVQKQSQGGKSYPSSIKAWRFTSPDEEAITRLANTYGGKARPWHNDKANPPDQFEVLTTSSVIAVSLVPASVSLSYEKWGNGFLRRRCDGITVHARKPAGKTVEVADLPCICNGKGQLECSPVTRLNVLLPGLTFKGVWLLQSNGWNVFSEMPGVMSILQQVGASGLIDAKLRLEERQKDGGSRKFVVPVIEFDQELAELSAGTQPAALEAGEAPAELVAADPLSVLEDDDVVDAEVVADDD